MPNGTVRVPKSGSKVPNGIVRVMWVSGTKMEVWFLRFIGIGPTTRFTLQHQTTGNNVSRSLYCSSKIASRRVLSVFLYAPSSPCSIRDLTIFESPEIAGFSCSALNYVPVGWSRPDSSVR